MIGGYDYPVKHTRKQKEGTGRSHGKRKTHRKTIYRKKYHKKTLRKRRIRQRR